MLKTTAEVAVVADPEMRFTKSGKAWMSIRCVSKRRKKDAQGKWVDGDPTWLSVIVFNRQAEMLAESNIGKGTRLIVAGLLENRKWEDNQGNERFTLELTADHIGLDTTFTAYSRLEAAEAARGAASRSDQNDDWAAPLPSDEPPW